MPGIKELKTRIKSIGSTRKITRAMQMVSAAKMRKAQQAALNSRSYSDLAWELINNLSQKVTVENPLLKVYPEAKKTGIIVVSTNTGLVGSFNSNVLNELRKMEKADVMAELFVMGRKAKDYAVRFNKNLKADFQKYDTRVSIDKIYPLAKMVSDLYKTGEYKNISIIYNKFISTLSQKVTVKQLLPFAPTLPPSPSSLTPSSDYLFEPDPAFVLNNLLPRIIESQIYQAVLESDAGEHSARMVTMKNATEAAGDLISDLTLSYNQLRQNKITTELAEITAGKIALE
jgi:F-type H+-transporting ATPase subunit gamma